jgi:hypothetical protein
VPLSQVDAILAGATIERPARRRWLRLVRRTRDGRGGRAGGKSAAAS